MSEYDECLFDEVQKAEARRYQEQMRLWSEAMERKDYEEVAKHGFGTMEEIKERESDHADAIIKAALEEFNGTVTMDFRTVVRMTMYTGRIYGPRILWYMDHFNCIQDEAYPRLVSYVWGLAEFPGLSLTKRDWLRLWKRAGFTIDGVPSPRPTETVTLYRGARATYKRGLAWTDNIDRAKWFVRGRYGNNHLYTLECPPDRLLARIHEEGRGEHEWVIDARALPLKELEVD